MRVYIAIALATVMTTAALAQDASAVFAALDADQNGSVSLAEAERNTIVTERFAEADSDGNGDLSPEEFETAFG